MSELWKYGAAELAAKIRSREVSSHEVVESHLGRIDRLNPRLNAVTAILGESALEAADATDRALASGDEVGPLAGVPMTVKENIDVAGSATTHGLVALKDMLAASDAPHIGELRAAGAIPIARTNLPDLGSRWHTNNALRGATLNPWADDRTPGGSSGGESSALAAGMTPLGMGNDIAGSLRWPAQCCGITALKPSLGRISFAGRRQPDLPMAFSAQLLAVHGPMARHVVDLRLAFTHMCADADGDPWHVPAPLVGPALPRRVTVVCDPGGRGVAPEVEDGVRRAARALEEAGYTVEEGDLPTLERTNRVYYQIMSRFAQATENAPSPAAVASQEFMRFWEALAGAWESAQGKPVHDPMAERRAVALEWDALLRGTPLIVAPVATEPAFPVGSDLDSAWLESWLAAIRAIVAVNVMGLPSVAVPTHEAGGLPYGVQIIGPRFREDLCLDAAEAVERALGSLTPIDPR